ncbi:MAG: ferritin family protein [Candidatus Zixiibacteriota bacterium]
MNTNHHDALSALLTGIQSEIASYVFYLHASKKTEAKGHRSILEKLASEEKEHFHILEKQYDSLVRSEKWISIADALKNNGSPEITEEMSQDHKKMINAVAEAKSLSELLDIAWLFEVEAYSLFLSEKEKCTSREGKEMYEKLSRFEQGHMTIISKLKTKLK